MGVSGTDKAALEELERQGFTKGRGRVWGQNNCLLDTLLQLLIRHGYLAGMREVDRREQCRACRSMFIRNEALHPRDSSGARAPGAYLQHHIHGSAAVAHFMAKCAALKPIPVETGLVLRVHARLPHLGDTFRLCAPGGLSIEEPGPTIHAYCFSGGGLAGFHYDPLFAADEVAVV